MLAVLAKGMLSFRRLSVSNLQNRLLLKNQHLNFNETSYVASWHRPHYTPRNKVVEGIMFLTGRSVCPSVRHHYVVNTLHCTTLNQTWYTDSIWQGIEACLFSRSKVKVKIGLRIYATNLVFTNSM